VVTLLLPPKPPLADRHGPRLPPRSGKTAWQTPHRSQAMYLEKPAVVPAVSPAGSASAVSAPQGATLARYPGAHLGDLRGRVAPAPAGMRAGVHALSGVHLPPPRAPRGAAWYPASAPTAASRQPHAHRPVQGPRRHDVHCRPRPWARATGRPRHAHRVA